MRDPKFVIDANIPISMVRDPEDKQADAVIQMVLNGEADMLLGPRLWAEYQTGLWHPDSLEARSPEYIERHLDAFAQKAIYVDKVPHQVDMERNRKDEHVINLAVYKEADFIITRDDKLLKLDRHPDWKEWFPQIRVISPTDLERELVLWQEQQQQLEHKQDREPSLSW